MKSGGSLEPTAFLESDKIVDRAGCHQHTIDTLPQSLDYLTQQFHFICLLNRGWGGENGML